MVFGQACLSVEMTRNTPAREPRRRPLGECRRGTSLCEARAFTAWPGPCHTRRARRKLRSPRLRTVVQSRTLPLRLRYAPQRPAARRPAMAFGANSVCDDSVTPTESLCDVHGSGGLGRLHQRHHDVHRVVAWSACARDRTRGDDCISAVGTISAACPIRTPLDRQGSRLAAGIGAQRGRRPRGAPRRHPDVLRKSGDRRGFLRSRRDS